jgi:hypothetical protein
VSHCLPLEQAQQAVELAQTDAAMKVVMAPHLAPHGARQGAAN